MKMTQNTPMSNKEGGVSMQKTFFAAAVVVLVVGLAGAASAQTATQVVTFTVASFQQITVGAGPIALDITAWTGADDNLTPVNGASTYSLLQNVGVSRITAQINSDMPVGTTLEVRLTPGASKGTSAGYQFLTSTAVNVVSAIPRGADNARAIDYRFSANASAGPIASGNRTVTYTLVSP
jgi:hypothetical protein